MKLTKKERKFVSVSIENSLTEIRDIILFTGNAKVYAKAKKRQEMLDGFALKISST